MAQDNKRKNKDNKKNNQSKGDQKRKNPFSVFQGAKDAGRLGSRSRREIKKATGRD